MAQTKTDYGLIYNTDGSVCTTVRPDQTPFPGVISFAVETATTNYFGIDAWEFDADKSTFYPDGLASGKTWADCWDTKQRAYVGGHNITAHVIYSRILDLGQVYSAGTKITLSWKHKGYLWYIRFYYGLTTDSLTDFNSTNTYEIKGDASLDYWEYTTKLHLKINNIKTNYSGSPQSLLDRWYDVEITYTLPADTRYIQIMWDFYIAYLADGGRGVKGYIHKPQIEVKPFASSFVAGSRQTGRLVIPVEDLKFDIANDDWVISYWKYPVATRNDTQNGYNLCSLGQNTSDSSKGHIWWGKGMNINKYRLYIVLNDATDIGNISDNTFNPADYFSHWHYEVLKKQRKVLSYYVDGVKQCELIIPADKEIQTPFDVGLSLGGLTEFNIFKPTNALIANVGNGKLKPGEFTDEHIMAIYEANRAFAQKGGVKIY